MTKVKFVIFKKELTALFPEEVPNNNRAFILSYARIGQHSEASRSLLKCKRATPEQYRDLEEELTNHCGYTLEIV
jgi:hypothetical protein